MVRHGMTEANKLGILQGAHLTLESAVLTNESRDQAREVGHRLRERWENAIDVCIVSSDLSRARETAQLIQDAWPEGGRPQHLLTPDIRERGLGSVEGMAVPASDIGKARAIYEERMRKGGFPADWKPIETFDAMRQRCSRFLAEYVEDGSDAWLPRSGFEKENRSTAGRVLICVGHGFCLQVLLALMTGEKEKPADQRLRNLQHTRLVRTITGSSRLDGSSSAWRTLEHRAACVW
jgi:broad specificity phosphatase PhoE